MEQPTQVRPWEQLAELLSQDALEPEAVETFLDELPSGELVRCVSRLTTDERVRLLEVLDPDDAADLVELLPETLAVEAFEELEPADAARIVEELPSNEQADLLGDLEAPEAEAILAEMPAGSARDLRTLAAYGDDLAGGLMVTEFLRCRPRGTMLEVVRSLRLRAEVAGDDDVRYVYVTSRLGRLLGVLRMRDLVLRAPATAVREVMIGDPDTVTPDAGLTELRRLFERHPYDAVPVVDPQRRLLGVVRRAEVEEAVADQSERDFQRAQGVVSGEELRSMPTLLRSRRRLGWLTINIGLNILAASVIAAHQDTLSAAIALAVFLPIISDMSGCSGNQAVAVTMRELSLGIVLPTEVRRVLLKELSVGALNGLLLGVLIAAAAWAWQGNLWLGAVVGAALALNTMVAVVLGGTIPLVLRRFGADPALAAGPVLTTVTDMVGFLLVLSLASAAMPLLTG